jgi:polar amino acid transport system permease protein
VLSLIIKLIAWAVGEHLFKRRRAIRLAAKRASTTPPDSQRIDTVIPGGAA